VRERTERVAMMAAAFDAAPAGWVLSGSLDGWGDPLIPRFEHVIFLTAPMEVRLSRLRARERLRYGAAIDAGGPLHDHHREFLNYAAGYDSGEFVGPLTGRHRLRHEAWLSRLPCPVTRLDGKRAVEVLVGAVLAKTA